MPRIGPIKRKELVKKLRTLGFEGPFSGGRHQFMIKKEITLRIPNPHQSDIGVDLLKRILKQARVNKQTWEKL